MSRIDHGAEEALRFGIARSPEWPRIAKAHLEHHPRCACCDAKTVLDVSRALQVHHVFPFHYCIALGRPDLELDERNLITLCETERGEATDNHHLLVGHLNSFQSSNLDVRTDAAHTFHGLHAARIRLDARWKVKVAHRLTPLESMTAQEKSAFRLLMNARLPRAKEHASPRQK